MNNITDLDEIIESMNPEIIEDEFIFSTVDSKTFLKLDLSKILLTFQEKEGLTIITTKNYAEENNLDYEGVWGLITLTVNSDLKAIGLLSTVTNALAKEMISVNAVSAYYHDHLFVPIEKLNKSLEILKKLSEEN